MKKLFYSFLLIFVLLVGCQTNTNGTLDTSELERIEAEGNLTEEQEKMIPITYKAPSVKAGLEALPFEMKLPEKLPFESISFHEPIIDDFSHDGKKIRVAFRASEKNNDQSKPPVILMIRANYPVIESQEPNFEEIKLANDVIGKYLGNSLVFQLENVSYEVVYVNKEIAVEQHKKEIIEIANQMF